MIPFSFIPSLFQEACKVLVLKNVACVLLLGEKYARLLMMLHHGFCSLAICTQLRTDLIQHNGNGTFQVIRKI